MARAASGLVWTIVFATLIFVLSSLFAWMILPLTRSPLTLGVVSLFVAAVIATRVLPTPWGSPRWQGVGFATSFRAALRESGLGLAIGSGTALAAIAPGILAGWTEIGLAEANYRTGLAGAVVPPMLILGSAGEELTLRGYGFQQFSRAVTPPGAAAAGAVIFAMLHYNNPGATLLSSVNTGLFGLLFGFALWRHRSIGLPFGLHLGWNMTLATLGAPISGLTIRITSLELAPVAAEIWSGGRYGPEATLPATVAVVIAVGAVWKIPALAPGRLLIWDDSLDTADAPSVESPKSG